MTSMGRENPLITAIVPIAGFPNGTEQIRSWITDRALAKYEIILVLDSDSIETEEIVYEIAAAIKENCPVVIIKSSHRNPGGTRNLGIGSAKGEWIVFWDCDDVPNPLRFVEIVEQAQREKADVGLGFYSVRSSRFPTESKEIALNEKHLLEEIALNPGLWRFAINHKIAKQLRFKEIRMAEDQIYLAELLIQPVKISITRKFVYEYWLYPGGQLTKDEIATSDLSIALLYVEQIYLKYKCKEIFIVFTRLTITSIKRNPLSQNMRTISKYVKIILGNWKLFPLAFRTLILIWNRK